MSQHAEAVRTRQKRVAKPRFQGSQWGLTYSCPTERDNPIPDKESLRDKLLDMYACKAYVVAHELHEDGSDHYHVFLHTKTRVDKSDPTLFDAFGVHPSIKVINPPGPWITYITKDGDYLIDGCQIPGERKRKAKEDYFASALMKARAGDLKGAIELVKTNEAMRWCLQSSQITAALKAEAASFRREQRPVVPRAGWIPEVEAIDLLAKREGEDFPRVHILVGHAGIGKTEAAKYLLRKAGCQSILVVNRLDDLKKLEHYDGFIWDEIDLQSSKKDREFQIGMCDMAEDRSFDARYHNVEIPAGFPRIFTCNFLNRAIDIQDSAIERRVEVHDFHFNKLF